jgi:low temperature requirement protein LtrA
LPVIKDAVNASDHAQPAAAPPAHARKVSWLELFFDLVFVAAVTQVAEPLRHHYSFHELTRLAPLFLLICWAWKGQAVFATRFGADRTGDRVLTLVQMFTLAALAANAKDSLDSESTAGFVAAYAVIRLILVGQYAHVRRATHAQALATRYLAGHGAAALLFLASAFVEAPARYWIWGLAAAIDFTTPWFAVPLTVDLPPDRAHLPERLGLFMLILLGDAVIAVMQGMESQDTWTPAAAVSAFLGMAILFLLWWSYFDGAAGAADQQVRTPRDAVRLHIWSYAHLPLYLGVIVTGVGLRRLVTSASRTSLGHDDAMILAGAVATVMVALIVIALTSGGRRRRAAAPIIAGLTAAIATAAIGGVGATESPLALSIVLGVLIVAVAAALGGTRRGPRKVQLIGGGWATALKGSRP